MSRCVVGERPMFGKWSYRNDKRSCSPLFLSDIERTDVTWYRLLTNLLSPEQEKAVQEIILLADQRKAALESKRIEQSGGK